MYVKEMECEKGNLVDRDNDSISVANLKLRKAVRFVAIFDIVLSILGTFFSVYFLCVVLEKFRDSFANRNKEEIEPAEIAFIVLLIITISAVVLGVGFVLPLAGAISLLRSTATHPKQLITDRLSKTKLWFLALAVVGGFILISLESFVLFGFPPLFHCLIMVLIVLPRLMASYFVNTFMKDMKLLATLHANQQFPSPVLI